METSIWKKDKPLKKLIDLFVSTPTLQGYRVIKEFIQNNYSLTLIKINQTTWEASDYIFVLAILQFGFGINWNVCYYIYESEGKYWAKIMYVEK